MNLEEIQRIQLSPSVDKPFSIIWSDDDKISLNMEKGLLVLDLVPDPNNTQKGFCLHRSWIAPAAEMPTDDVGIKINELYCDLKQQNLQHLIEDMYLAPKLNTASVSPPHIVQVAWSPAGMLLYERCLLGTLTNYGCTLVQAPRGKHWYTVADISLLWKNYCNELWTPPKTERPDKLFRVLQDRVGRLRITCITWSGMFKTKSLEMGLFITGMQNGEIAIWQLNVAENFGDIKLDPKLVMVFSSGLKRITAMLWSTVSHNKACLWLGDTRGCIKMFTFCVNGLEVSNESCLDLWTEKELLTVSKFLLLSASENSQTLLAVKETFLFAFHISESNVAVRSQLIGNLAVYGIEKFNEEIVLLAAYSACIKMVRILRDENELNIESETIMHVKESDYGYYGLTASKNKAIWALSTSVCKPFDHLVLREPAQLLLFTLPGFVEPYGQLLDNRTQSLANHWDCLELIRLQGTAMSYIDIDMHDFDELETYQLKVKYWLTKFALLNENTEEKFFELHNQISAMSKCIMLRQLCEVVQKLELKASDKSKMEQQSLILIHYWLQKFSADPSIGEGTKYMIRKVLGPVKEELIMDEECAVCKTKVGEPISPIEMQCPSQHSLPRCSICLLQCSEVPYWLCKVCHSLACREVEAIQQPVCNYCDLFMCLDERLLI